MNLTQIFLVILSVVLVVVLGWLGLNYVFSPSPESADRLDAAMVRHLNPLADGAVTAAAAKDKGIVESARAEMARDLESKQEATRQAAIDELTRTATEPLLAKIAELEAKLAAKEQHNCELLRMVDSAMLRQPLQWPPVTVNMPPAPAPAVVAPVTPAPVPVPAPVAPPAPAPPAPIVAPVAAPAPTAPIAAPAPVPAAIAAPATASPCPDVTL
jgi:hypothetical protein